MYSYDIKGNLTDRPRGDERVVIRGLNIVLPEKCTHGGGSPTPKDFGPRTKYKKWVITVGS